MDDEDHIVTEHLGKTYTAEHGRSELRDMGHLDMPLDNSDEIREAIGMHEDEPTTIKNIVKYITIAIIVVATIVGLVALIRWLKGRKEEKIEPKEIKIT